MRRVAQRWSRALAPPGRGVLRFSTAQQAYQHIDVQQRGSARWVILNRGKLHNAFNEDLIAELTHAFRGVSPDACRSVVLTGNGPSFSAGADLSWMKRMAGYTREENRADALRLFDMFHAIRACPVPVIARVNGTAVGGGSGLVAACDIPIAVSTAVFGFSEVRLGLIPAVISPFVMDKIGAASSRFFLTGERFSAAVAHKVGLVTEVHESMEAVDKAVAAVVEGVEKTSPAAVQSCKTLIATVRGMDIKDARAFVAEQIASARASPDGVEGVAAFLEKRKPGFEKQW
jgi:methylglutaconyl-CoA hydratase